MKNKKGLSLVITTLIIVLLVLVAIGIIWVVIRGVIEGGAEQVDVNTKCLDIDVRATAVDCTDGICNVTLTRKSGGDEIGGVMLVFKNANEDSSDVKDIEGNIGVLSTIIAEDVDSTITVPNKVEVTVYLNISKEKKICSQTNPFSF